MEGSLIWCIPRHCHSSQMRCANAFMGDLYSASIMFPRALSRSAGKPLLICAPHQKRTTDNDSYGSANRSSNSGPSARSDACSGVESISVPDAGSTVPGTLMPIPSTRRPSNVGCPNKSLITYITCRTSAASTPATPSSSNWRRTTRLPTPTSKLISSRFPTPIISKRSALTGSG